MNKEDYQNLNSDQQRYYRNFYIYQRLGGMHPLTCGNDSNHEVLDLIVENGEFKLSCPDCEYTQKFDAPFFCFTIKEPVFHESDGLTALSKNQYELLMEEFKNKFHN